MESQAAIARLSALAQPGRLSVFRLLVRAGPEGVAAGDIAAKMHTAPNTLSAQLAVLVHAGLIRYAAHPEAIRDLILYLMDDCCDGHPEICAPVQEAARAACCAPKKTKPRKTARA
jgi:DNA-binding transcriptional ArsR family regulator